MVVEFFESISGWTQHASDRRLFSAENEAMKKDWLNAGGD